MASSDPELKDGFNLPVWMKTKPTKDFELFAASPPPAEDSFFFIRYPKKETIIGQTLEQELPNLLKQNTTDLPSAAYNGREKDWSRHTKPCQEVIHGIAPINTAVNSATSKPKSAGTDDGFKGEGAACGSSVVKVAHAMMSRGPAGRGFAVASPDDEAPSAHYMAARRGSRSLPASPPGSPNSRRKNNNRYFTSPFEPVGDGSGRSWLTMALLGFKKDLTTSTSTLAEEDVIEDRLHAGSSLAQSVESLGPAPRSKDPSLISDQSPATQQPKLAKPAHAFRPKPTELREMNFWSPTSM